MQSDLDLTVTPESRGHAPGIVDEAPRGTGLAAIYALYGRAIELLNGIGTIWSFGLMAIIIYDVTGRFLFNSPLPGVPETVAYSIVAIVFSQVAHTIHTGRVTRSEALLVYMKRAAPVALSFYNLTFTLAGCVIFYIFGAQTWPRLVEAYLDGVFFGHASVFTAPLWPIYAFVVIGSFAALIEFALRAIHQGSVFIKSVAGRGRGSPASADWIFILLLAGLAALTLFFLGTGPDRLHIGIASVIGIVVLIMLGMPVPIALIVVSIFGIYSVRSFDLAQRTLGLSATGTINEYIFGVIPLFVFMGLIISKAGIGRDTFDVAQWLVGKLRGGLGIATVVANAIFAAITGVSVASAAVFTRVASPEMRRRGYSKRFSVGVVAGSSVLGMLIPPSLLLIVYAVIAEVSVGRLFLAAIVPGIGLALAFCILIVAATFLAPGYIGENIARRPSDDEPELTFGQALSKILPIVVLILLVLGGIYGGVFTPTEAGAAGAGGAVLVALLKRRLSPRALWAAMIETGHISVMILIMVIAASVYTKLLAFAGVPVTVTGWVTSMDLPLLQFMLVYILLLILMGMLLDSVSIMLIILPLALPVVQAMGADLIWFGIVTTIAIEIGLLTPPFGMAVFVVKSTLEDQSITLGDIFTGVAPFAVAMLVVTLLLILFPATTALL